MSPESRSQAPAVIRGVVDVLNYYRAMGIERFPFPVSDVRTDAVSDLSGCHTATIDVDLTSAGEQNAVYNDNAQLSPEEKTKRLSALRDKIGDCMRCKLSAGRTNIVFGEGDPDARLMFIGEGPGEDEDLQGRPFVGKAGVLLTRLIEKMELRREDVYIANIVKCRPPGNREPEQDEVGSCRGFLEEQIEIIRPTVIMTLGNVALQSLMKNAALKISAVRGKLLEFRGHTVIPTFHPAYLLRNPADKWKTWADAQKALEKLHLRP